MPNLLSQNMYLFFSSWLDKVMYVCAMGSKLVWSIIPSKIGDPYFAISTKADLIYAIFHNFSFKWENLRQLEIITVPLAWILKNTGFLKWQAGINGF